MQELQASDAVLEGPVVGVNRGGAIVLVKVKLLPLNVLEVMLLPEKANPLKVQEPRLDKFSWKPLSSNIFV